MNKSSFCIRNMELNKNWLVVVSSSVGRKYEKRHGVSFLGIESRNDVFLQKTEMRRGRGTLLQKAMYM